jgi:hypothetical protein
MKTLKSINVSKVAAAIEADAGQALPGLRESLAEAKAGKVGKVHPPRRLQRGSADVLLAAWPLRPRSP